MSEEAVGSRWRRVLALAVLVVGALASMGTSPNEPEVIEGEPEAAEDLVLDAGRPAVAIPVSVTADEPGDYGLVMSLTTTGAPVLVSLEEEGRSAGSPSSGVVSEGQEPTEVGRGMRDCDEGPCVGQFVARLELLDPDGAVSTVAWTAVATTVAPPGENSDPGTVEVGEPTVVEPMPSLQTSVLDGLALDPSHAGKAAAVRLSGPTTALLELDANLVISTLNPSASSPASLTVELVDPVDGVPVTTNEALLDLRTDATSVVELNVDGASCDPSGDCDRVFWVLISQSGSGTTSLDVVIDVRGESLGDVDVDVPPVATTRYDGPISFDAEGIAALPPVGALPTDTSVVAWSSAATPPPFRLRSS